MTVTVVWALRAAVNTGPPENASAKVAVVDGSCTKRTPPRGPVSSTATLTHFLLLAS